MNTETSQAIRSVSVSVIIPAFNASATLSRAVDSVMLQHMTSIEIIIIDDGSADDTYAKILALASVNPTIVALRMDKNRGVSAARNTGIRAARGEFLAFLDADDIWLEGKLDKQLAAIKCDPAITLVSCNSVFVTEAGEILKEGHRNRPPVEGENAWKTLLVYNFLPTPTVLTYRALVLEIGGFDESLAVAEDLDLWIKLALRGKVRVLHEILIKYFDSNGSLMKRFLGQFPGIWLPLLEKHMQQQQDKLTPAEIRTIKGQQSFQTGCNLYFAGEYLNCIPVFVNAALRGMRPLKSISYIPRALLMSFFSIFRR